MALAAQILIGAETATQLVSSVIGDLQPAVSLALNPLMVVLFFATVVVFVLWFRRCRLNVDRIAPGSSQYTVGLASWGWFIPLAMWWIPYRIALDIWRATAPGAKAWLVHAWWVAWLAKTVGGVIAVRLGQDLSGDSPFGVATALAAATLAILFVQQLTDRQQARLRALPSA
ncbi:DUF4328 domain-containing protein [Kitasatospora sp. NPDC004531]